jgi:hypothetical protein
LETSAALYCHDDTVSDGDIAHETVGSGAVDVLPRKGGEPLQYLLAGATRLALG